MLSVIKHDSENVILASDTVKATVCAGSFIRNHKNIPDYQFSANQQIRLNLQEFPGRGGISTAASQ